MTGQASNPVEVIGERFVRQDSVVLTIANDCRVTGANGSLFFSVGSKRNSIHGRRYLKDAAGNILVTLRKKIPTLHGRRQVFKGKSKDEKDLLFSVKTSSPKRTQLDVFLASNTSESVPDFKVKGSDIYCLPDGEPDFIIAKVVNNTDNIEVEVYPNVDHAFVLALVVAGALVDDTSGQFMKLARWALELGRWVAVLVPLLTE